MGSCIGSPADQNISHQIHPQHVQANVSNSKRAIQIPVCKETVLQTKADSQIQSPKQKEHQKYSQNQMNQSNHKDQIKQQIAKLILKSKQGLIILRHPENIHQFQCKQIVQQTTNISPSKRVVIQFQRKHK